ncbi:hypothetical protein [Halorientalis salina]|uniref:hypothetical protein n=1 Tax=Halorientalis salina TaxID=2932266 RepID=UPI0010AD065D|nr:hypothetical protein [Halorientalis salina]
MSDGPGVGARLEGLRADRFRRRLATAGAVVVGLATVWLHWAGLVVGGALVAFVQPTVRRGLVAGVGFGVLAWLAFAGWLASAGSLDLYLGMGQVFAVSTAITLAGSLLGALARGVR